MQKEEKMSLLKSNEGMSTFQTRWIGQQGETKRKVCCDQLS